MQADGGELMLKSGHRTLETFCHGLGWACSKPWYVQVGTEANCKEVMCSNALHTPLRPLKTQSRSGDAQRADICGRRAQALRAGDDASLSSVLDNISQNFSQLRDALDLNSKMQQACRRRRRESLQQVLQGFRSATAAPGVIFHFLLLHFRLCIRLIRVRIRRRPQNTMRRCIHLVSAGRRSQ